MPQTLIPYPPTFIITEFGRLAACGVLIVIFGVGKQSPWSANS